MRFWDSSALVPQVVREPRTEEMRALWHSDPIVVIWWGTPVECLSALCRRVREGAIPDSDRQRLEEDLQRLVGSAVQIVASDEVRDRALDLLRRHSLRAADSLQLAAGLAWAEDQPSGRAFVCLDDRLRAAASTEGFQVLPG